MKKISILNDRCIKKEYKILLFLIGMFLVTTNIVNKNIIEIIIGIILIYIPFFNKITIITEEGIEIHYSGLIYKHKELIDFNQLTNIRIEYVKNKTALHFLKNHIGKRLILKNEDVQCVIELAKLKNNNIYFDEMGI